MLLGGAGFLCISRPRDDAELLHHSEVVSHRPVFHDLPIDDAHDIDEVYGYRSAGRRDAHELTLVGTVKRLACGDLVPFGDHVLYGEVGVGEGLAEHGRN